MYHSFQQDMRMMDFLLIILQGNFACVDSGVAKLKKNCKTFSTNQMIPTVY